MNIVETLNLRMMAGRVAVAANQLQGTETGLFSGIQLLMDIGQKQDGGRRLSQLFSNIAVGLYFTLGPYQGVKIAVEQMSNITFIAVAK